MDEEWAGSAPLVAIRGRGAVHNPPNRFERLSIEADGDWLDADALEEDHEPPAVETQYFRDHTRSIVARNDSPDVSFTYSINPYRGCSHGCSYCFARPFHEYLGLSSGLDFESRIFVKTDAAALLRQKLASPRWVPDVIAISGVTDPYQPIERKLRITRSVLEVLAESRNPVAMITKNHLITRDADLLGELARHDAAVVTLSITTLRNDLQRVMEPRASTPSRRLAAVETLASAGVPVNVLVAPVIPGLTDDEIPAILRAVADAGASSAGYIALRLPHAVKQIFESWLELHYPERKTRVLNKIRGMREGKLYQSRWGTRMRGDGAYAEHIEVLFDTTARRLGLRGERRVLSTAHFRRPSAGPQLDLF